MGFSVLAARERSSIERQIKQLYKDGDSIHSISTVVTSTSTTETTSTGKKKGVSPLESFLSMIDREETNDKTKARLIMDEVHSYRLLVQQHQRLDALAFWKLYHPQYPILSKFARKYLSTPATSVPSESAFSSSAYVERKERARLSSENLSLTVFLRDKLKNK